MGKLLIALICMAAIGLCGCTVSGVPANQAPVEQKTSDDETLELDGLGDELGNADVASMEEPVNPSGKTEIGCMVTGLPYEVGPVEFNCPSEYMVTEKTDDSMELCSIDGVVVKVEVTYGERSYPSADKADLTKQTLENAMRESYPSGFEMRWIEYTPTYTIASYIGDQVLDDQTNKIVGDYVYSSDYSASMLIVVRPDDFPSCKYTVLDIADTFRVRPLD